MREEAPRLRGWSIVEHKSVGTDEYVLFRRNRTSTSGFESLTKRERVAVQHACVGLSNKEIAYLMGVTPSTIGTLLWRAARKIGATNRGELLTALAAPHQESAGEQSH
jgi:DNA-binding CsgD family transcriptional regulator